MLGKDNQLPFEISEISGISEISKIEEERRENYRKQYEKRKARQMQIHENEKIRLENKTTDTRKTPEEEERRENYRKQYEKRKARQMQIHENEALKKKEQTIKETLSSENNAFTSLKLTQKAWKKAVFDDFLQKLAKVRFLIDVSDIATIATKVNRKEHTVYAVLQGKHQNQKIQDEVTKIIINKAKYLKDIDFLSEI